MFCINILVIYMLFITNLKTNAYGVSYLSIYIYIYVCVYYISLPYYITGHIECSG